VLGPVFAGRPAEAREEQRPGAGPRRVEIEPREAKKPAARAGEENRAANIRVEKQLVQINVTVTTPLGQVVTGMEKKDFRLFEDEVEQEIVSLSSEEAPLPVGLVFNISHSMGAKLHKSREAAAQSFKTANPDDQFFLVQFNDRPEMVVPWTANTEEIQNRMVFTQAKGRTALLDGLYLAK
jgi:VWFA-related protein